MKQAETKTKIIKQRQKKNNKNQTECIKIMFNKVFINI